MSLELLRMKRKIMMSVISIGWVLLDKDTNEGVRTGSWSGSTKKVYLSEGKALAAGKAARLNMDNLKAVEVFAKDLS